MEGVETVPDPIAIFRTTFQRASEACEDPEVMVLATVDPDGRPAVRYVLLKSFDDRGFVFFTNLRSRKARALEAHPHAALAFYWTALGRQVRIEGRVEPVSTVEADDYFRTRPRASQIGAWASEQSAPLESRQLLEQKVAETARRFEGGTVPRPPFWSGFRVVPDAIEFWISDPARLHERQRFDRNRSTWTGSLLYP